jgi:hypothetical protein
MTELDSSQKSVGRARNRLVDSVNTALRIYAPAREWMRYSNESFDEQPYQPRIAQKVVGLSFLSMVAAWEEFVEHLFLSYMAGAKSPSGYAPRLTIGPCKNRPHAVRVLGSVGAGDPHRLFRWNDWGWVTHVAAVYFKNGLPFSKLGEPTLARLRDAQTIRNRVAHNSSKARIQFKRCVNNLLGEPQDKAMPRGFSPGQFLGYIPGDAQFPPFTHHTREDHQWGDYFECYVSLFAEVANSLAPGNTLPTSN